MNLHAAYKLFLIEKESSCRTESMQYYSENVLKFVTFVSSSTDTEPLDFSCDEITHEMLVNYVGYLRMHKRFENHPFLLPSDDVISSTSVHTYFRAVKVFIHWCDSQGYLNADILKNVKLPKAQRTNIVPLYSYEVAAIDALFNLNTESGLRNYCIVHLMLDTGFRSSEVINLKINNILFSKNLLQFVGKGGKERVVPLPSRLKTKLYRYCMFYRGFMDVPGEYTSAPVFVQLDKPEFINDNVIKQLFARIKKRSGVPRVHPHLLRHTFATSFIMGGGGFEFLRLLLGHADYKTTLLYVHLANLYMMLGADIYKLDSCFFKTVYRGCDNVSTY